MTPDTAGSPPPEQLAATERSESAEARPAREPRTPLRARRGRLRRTQRQWLLNGLLGAVLVAALISAAILARGTDSAAANTAAIRTVAVQKANISASVTADGSVEAVNEVAANFATPGTIETIKVAVGATVKKGAALATLATGDLARNLKVAELQLEAAQEQLDAAEEGTTTTDVKSGSSTTTVNDAQVASASASLIQAQATVEDAESAVAAATLTASIGGTVLQVNGKVGSSTGSSATSGAGATGTGADAATSSTSTTDFVVIADLTKLQVTVSVPERDIASLKVGQSASVTFPAVDKAAATAKITSIDPVGTTNNGVVTFGVAVQLTDVPDSIRLGQTASVTVTTASVKDAEAVPSTTVTTRGDRSTVTLVTNGQQVATVVKLGVVGDSYAEVTSGVQVGDRVLLATASATQGSENSPFPGGGGLGGGVPPMGGFQRGGPGAG